MPKAKEFSEEQVVAKALQTFWCKGYEATSTRDLVAATGISYGSLYHTYKDKRSLFLAALDCYYQQFVTPVLNRLAEASQARETITQLFYDTIKADVADRRGCFLLQTTVEVAAQDKDVGQRVDQISAQLESAYTQLLSRAQQQGQLSQLIDVHTLAQLLIATLTGIHVRAHRGATQQELLGIANLVLTLL